ncbi:two-component regulator propeller domain-containing protein [Sphingomonas endolithica]|uniref:sensor histidine kinase n=1 Tax=Sphingomonas endolithica TaxID=2972485 RepID=UPI0021B00F3D|nr:two-component regulator propeller domain-containing protein [Sphingomonas sp. ZFBP2030]
MLVRRILVAISTVYGSMSATPAYSLDPALSIAQYKHTRWTVDDGAPPGMSFIVQGKEGFLWIGAKDGLYRFDGLTFEAIPPQRQIGDRQSVTALLAARDGSLWVGYAAGGIARYAAGVLRDAGVPNPTQHIQQLIQTRDGAIWGLLGRSERPLVRFSNGKWEDIGADWGLPRIQGVRLLEARDGTLWFAASSALYSLRAGSKRFDLSRFTLMGSGALAQGPDGNVWVADKTSARAIGPGRATRFPYLVPYTPRGRRAIFDRDGNLWGNSDSGIYRIRAPDPRGEASASMAHTKVDRFRESASLASDNVNAIVEDREGNIWVTTDQGLDRFRAVSVVAEPLLNKVPQWGNVMLAATNGEVFVGQEDGVFRVRPRGNPEQVLAAEGDAEAMCQGPDGDIWMVMQHRIVRFREQPIARLRKPVTRQSINDCAVDRHGRLFLTAGEGLIARVGNGWRIHKLADDDQTGGAMPIIVRSDGKLLTYASSRSLRVYAPPRFTDFVLGRRAAIRHLRTIYDTPDAILLGGRFGLAKVRGTSVRFLAANRAPAVSGTVGIVSTPEGDTWLMSRSNISRIATASLDRAFDDAGWNPPIRTFDFRDGLMSGGHLYGKRDAVRGGDGRLWFATMAGTVRIDPAHLPRNRLPPPVAISILRVDGVIRRDPTSFVVQPGASKIAIDFSALSLGIPERVQVRYQLDGIDDGWIDPGAVRRASYANLSPGRYRFRVIAANEDGVWNTKGAALDLTIRPTFFQSTAFLALCIVAGLLLLWLAYSVRMRQLTARVRGRFEAQLAERERIARELHDTLLQGFQGLVLRFQSVANRMPPGSSLKGAIDEALEHAEDVLTEGRNRVNDLRIASSDEDLAGAIVEEVEKLGLHPALPVSVTTEGQVRPLVVVVREELLRIAGEAIRNAVQHSGASRIEVLLLYGRRVQLSVRDDGRGLPNDVADAGSRPGHFGLVGMRERAERVGGEITIVSLPGQGTEVYVTVPGRLAYLAGRTRAERAL